MLRAVYESEKAVDSGTAVKNIYNALKAIGKDKIVDVSEVKKFEVSSGSNRKNNEQENEPKSNLAHKEHQELNIVTNNDLAKACHDKWQELSNRIDDSGVKLAALRDPPSRNNESKESNAQSNSCNKEEIQPTNITSSNIANKNKDILIIAPSNDLRDKISSLIREHYVKGDSQTLSVLTNSYRTKAQISDIREYNGNEIVSFEKNIKSLGIKAGDTFLIDKINCNQAASIHTSSTQVNEGSIELIRQSDNKRIIWNPSQKSNFATLYERKEIDIAEGERIRWTKNSKVHSFIMNGDTATIERITDKNVTIKTASGNKYTITKEDMRFMDYGYTSSTYSSQGKTSKYVIGISRAKEKFLTLSHQRSFYVTISRASKEAHLIIDNYKDLIQSLSKKEGDKTSATEHQSELSKDNKVIATNPETTERVKLIKSSINQLIKEYKSTQKASIERKENSLSSYLKENISDLKVKQTELNKVKEEFLSNSAYSDPQEALSKWNSLVARYELTEAISRIESNPKAIGELKGKTFLFFNDRGRKEALSQIKQSINTLINLEKIKDYLKLSKRSVNKLDKEYHNILKQAFSFKTRNITHTKMKRNITQAVKTSLSKIDGMEFRSGVNVNINANIITNGNNTTNTNKDNAFNVNLSNNYKNANATYRGFDSTNHNMTISISKRVEEKIIEFKTRYKREPSITEKASMFIQAKYEYERKSYYLKQLNKKKIPKTKIEQIRQIEKADKLSKIDANLAIREHSEVNGMHKTPEHQVVMNAYQDSQNRIEKLTKSYIKQGYSIEQASNIAHKIVNYEIDNNNHPSIRKIKAIEQESKTFNLDKTIIKNMGINGKDAEKLISKLEGIELNKLDAKQIKELGLYDTGKVTNKAVQNEVNITKGKTMDTTQKTTNMDHSRRQDIVRDKDMGIEI